MDWQQSTRRRVRLGHVVLAIGAAEVLDGHAAATVEMLQRHAQGDWGDLDAHDRAVNEAALQQGGRLLSQYAVAGQRIWIITDQGETTILLPDEY